MNYHTKLEAMSKGRQLTEMLRLQSLLSSGVSASLNLLQQVDTCIWKPRTPAFQLCKRHTWFIYEKRTESCCCLEDPGSTGKILTVNQSYLIWSYFPMFRHLPKLYNIDINGSAKGVWIDGTLLRRFSLETLISSLIQHWPGVHHQARRTLLPERHGATALTLSWDF